MKISNDSSLLFVKQDLLINTSLSKASNASGRDLDAALIADRNKFDRDIFGDSYNVELKSKKIAVGGMITPFGYLDSNSEGFTSKTITFNKGDYDDFTITTGDAAYDIETYVQAALGSFGSRSNQAVYTYYMQDFARSLNSYMRFQGDHYDPEQDSYLQSLTDRFDALDPEQQDSRLNQMRKMIKTAQGGSVIHVDDDDFIKQVEQSAITEPTIISPTTTINNKDNKETLTTKKVQAYRISMIQAQNSANLVSKMLGDSYDNNNAKSIDNILNFNQDNGRTADIEMRNKKLKLEQEEAYDISTKQEPYDEQPETKIVITAKKWNDFSTNYASEHKKDLPLLDAIHNQWSIPVI